jgi:RNA 2',3'-cyclic 3'-phosphodiesterase
MIPDPPRQPESATDTIRAFVALEVPTLWRDELSRLLKQLKLRPGAASVRWVPTGQIHLTLRFLGNVAAEAVNPLRLALAAACEGVKPFELGLGGLGGFPDLTAPRVVWIGLDGATAPLAALQQRVEAAARDAGDHQEDRAFHPHLTLGRVQRGGPRASGLGDVAAHVRLTRPAPWLVRDVCLIRSELGPNGARYTVLARVPLLA